MQIYNSDHGQIYQGDCLEIMKSLPGNSIETCITDPPAGISFMGKPWDSHRGGRDKWIAWAQERFSEVFRILKPGGLAFVWAFPRTAHWPATALENAGFEIINKSYFLFGAGWPKGLDLSKKIDKHFGCVREKKGLKIYGDGKPTHGKKSNCHEGYRRPWMDKPIEEQNCLYETEPVHPLAQLWNGWNSQLKPMCEEWLIGMKPTGKVYWNELWELTGNSHWIIQVDLDKPKQKEKYGIDPAEKNAVLFQYKPLLESESFYDQIYIDGKPASQPFNVKPFRPWHSSGIVENALKWGVAGYNIGECRIPSGEIIQQGAAGKNSYSGFNKIGEKSFTNSRYPGNVAIDDEVAKELDERFGERKSGKMKSGKRKNRQGIGYGELPENYDETEASTGGASRFFTHCNWEPTDFYFSGKACQSEKNMGCDHMPDTTIDDGRKTKIDNPYQRKSTKRKNSHPTVKSIQFMRWLCRLSKTPTGGTIIDPFAGTYSTLIAAYLEGRKFIGIELEPEYNETGMARLKEAMGLFFEVKNEMQKM